MASNSKKCFSAHFSENSLHDIVDLHLKEGVARGVDGISYENFLKSRNEEIKLISTRALSGNYKFSPYRQKLILKNAESLPRQVSIPTLRDRIALRALNNFIAEIFLDCRPQHVHPIITSIIKCIRNMGHNDCFIKLDVRSFYDTVSHEILIRNVRRRIRTYPPLKLLEDALKNPTGTTVASQSVNKIGIPQGLSVSNILSSIYLQSIDNRFKSMSNIIYQRYVDDILCIVNSSDAEYFADAIIKKLKNDKKLTCHPIGSGKSTILQPNSNITYLGYILGKGKISVRRETEKKFMSSIMKIIFGTNITDIDRAIWRINLRITGCRIYGTNLGWIFYFSQINDLSLLSRMDSQIRSAVIRRFGVAAAASVKRLLKTYHQVKYTINSNYLPDFGNYSRQEMEYYINLIAPGKFRNLDEKSDDDIARIFNASVWKEVRHMEQDTLGSFS